METTMQERVQKGAALLDAHFGGSIWRGRIDLATLDIRHPKQCILGQLFGDYFSGGLVALRLPAASPAAHDVGFIEHWASDPEHRDRELALEQAWHDYLSQPVRGVTAGDRFYLTVSPSGIVSLWGTEEQALKASNEAYVPLLLTLHQQTVLAMASDFARALDAQKAAAQGED